MRVRKAAIQRCPEFDVEEDGTLTVADFREAATRSECYEDVSDTWSGCPASLAEAMDDCQPLASAVHALYEELREELVSDLQRDGAAGRSDGRRRKALLARLKRMPEEPYDGAVPWLLELATTEFETRVVPKIEAWFDSPPDWSHEEDYIPRDMTAQGAALRFFQDMEGDDLDALGVEVVEGEHPGSSYYAATLTLGVRAANKAASAAGIAVRFRRRRN